MNQDQADNEVLRRVFPSLTVEQLRDAASSLLQLGALLEMVWEQINAQVDRS